VFHLTETQLREVIRRCLKGDIDPKRPESEQEFCLYTKRKDSRGRRRLLGRHASREEALGQERLIQMRKRGG
jgi:hypothetical protein